MRLTRVLMAARKLPKNYHNMPDRYIKRNTMFLIKRTPNMPQYEEKIHRYKTDPYYDEWRLWERESLSLNKDNANTPMIFVEPIKEWIFFRGDKVEVVRGPEKGKQGIITYIVKERNWVFVQGLNLVRTTNTVDANTYGIVSSKENPLLINLEVKLVDPSDFMPTDVEWRYDDDGNRLRVSTRTERIIPMPDLAYETIDYVRPENYKESDKDTPASAVKEVTYKPEAKTFEMDICEEHKIKDERIPYPSYWY